MNRNLIALLIALIIVAFLIYFFRAPLASLLNTTAGVPGVTPVATATPAPGTPTVTPTPASQASSFDKTGNLTRNNPGNTGNAWYLTYEQPGSPALNVKLNFSDSTPCQNCTISTLKPGDRVEVSGNQSDNASEVDVQKIRLLTDTK